MKRVYSTLYRSRAETDLAVYHATLRTIDESVNFDEVADSYGRGDGMYFWIMRAKKHWPDPLAKLECVLAISVLDVYAQAILFTLFMKSKGVPYSVYSSDWVAYFQDFKKWRRGRSTQNLEALMNLLKKEFSIDVAIRDSDRELVEKANKVRNAFVHASSYHEILDPGTYLSFIKPEPRMKDHYGQVNLGEFPRILNEIVGMIDQAVLEKYDLPDEILMWRQG